MEHTVVCIARQDGSGAREVAQLVAAELGFRVVDEDILARVAAEAGVDREAVADVERRKSRVVSLLEGLGSAGMVMSYVQTPDVGGLAEPESAELRELIRTVIEEVADDASAVIVSHAASLALGERGDVLRVLVVASSKLREQRTAASLQVDAKEAARTLKRSDAARADYIKRFYGVGEELPTHYDLVINTDKLSVKEAAWLIVHAARGLHDGAHAPLA